MKQSATESSAPPALGGSGNGLRSMASRVLAVVPKFWLPTSPITPPVTRFEISRLHTGEKGLLPPTKSEAVEISNQNLNHFRIEKMRFDFARPVTDDRIELHQPALFSIRPTTGR